MNVKNGGIWQISRPALEDVQQNLEEKKKIALKDKFNVDVTRVNHDRGDLLDVRTAAAVARAFVYRKPAKIPEENDGQAAYWVRKAAYPHMIVRGVYRGATS